MINLPSLIKHARIVINFKHGMVIYETVRNNAKSNSLILTKVIDIKYLIWYICPISTNFK